IRDFIALSSAHEKRRQRMWVAACLAVTLVTTALGGFALVQKFNAEDQKHDADVERNLAVTSAELAEANAKRALENEKRSQSRLLATLSTQSVGASDAVSGMLLGLEALPDPKFKDARPYLPEAEESLFNALNNQKESVVLNGAADFSPDGKQFLAISGAGRTVRIRDVKTVSVTKVLQGHADTITAATFSRDGTRVATASRDDTVRIWSADTGAQLKILKSPKPSGIDFSHDGTRVLISSAHSSTRIWDVATGRETVLQGEAANAQFSPDGNRIVSEGSSLNAPAVWDA